MTSDEDTKILGDTLGDSPHRYSAIESNDDISSTIGERSEKTFGAEDENGLDLESKSIPVVEKYSKTVALCFVMFGMGTMHAIIGPTLLDLAYGLSVSLSQVSLLFVGQASGFIVGVIGGGLLCDLVDHWLLMCCMASGAALLTVCVPLWPSLFLLVSTSVLRGACMRSLELVVNIVLLDLWDKDSSSPMQQLHFTVAVGCGLAPLLTKPFSGTQVSPDDSSLSVALRQIASTFSDANYSSSTTSYLSEPTTTLDQVSSAPLKPKMYSVLGNETSHIDLEHSRVEWVYLIVGVLNLTVGVYLFIIYCCFPYRKSKSQHESTVFKQTTEEEKLREFNFRIRFIPVGIALLALYFGVLLAYDGYLVTFAVVSDLKMSISEATTLSATFWLTFALGRFLAIFYSMYLSDYTIMHIDVICLVFSSIPLSTSLAANTTAFYICSMIFALSFASLGPAALSYTSRYLTINGKIGAIYMVGGSSGEIVLPFVIAYMMDNFDPMWLMYIVTACTLTLYPLATYKFYLAGIHGERRD